MADPTQPNSTSGADPSAVEPSSPSLRDVAEAAYDETTSTESEAPRKGSVARDRGGRFASKEQVARSGEAEPRAPSPEDDAEATVKAPDPAAQARSNQPPDHWSAEDRAVFERLPPEAQSMLQRRYSEMEADYTRKSQANASAVQAVNALAPIFSDPDIQRSLSEWQMHPIAAIQQWAGFHKRAVSPHIQDRAGLLIDLATQMGFDPARLFATNRPPEPQLPPEVAKDPAVRYLADQYGKTAGDLQALRNEVQGIRAAEAQKYEQESLKVTRWSIDTFADEKGPDGKPLRPDFDDQLPFILELYKANPERDLAEAYDLARRMNPKTWEQLVASERSRLQSQQSVDRAKAANRGNVRGLTAPVSKPNAKTGNGSLRDLLEASADEVGF
jgi:hypothetical protein